MKTWTDDEVKILMSNYETTTNEDLKKLIPNKSQCAIYKKAHKAGLRKTPETKFLDASNARRSVNHQDVFVTRKGYRMIYMPSHPRADSHGRVFEHIVVWEKAHGMNVPEGYCIHHINGEKADNRPENLLFLKIGEHSALHNKRRKHRPETKAKISKRAKERFKDSRKHPGFKDIDVSEMISCVEHGEQVKTVCEKYGINKSTYYNKIRRGF